MGSFWLGFLYGVVFSTLVLVIGYAVELRQRDKD